MERRLFRITYNKNNWEYPSGRYLHNNGEVDSSSAYENIHGYGHEEWLFNARYRIGEYQYGYINGVEKMN